MGNNSVLAAVSQQLQGTGKGYVKFPAGTHLVQLAALDIKTEWREGKPVEFRWDKNDQSSVVPGFAVDARFSILPTEPGGQPSKPMSIKNLVLPCEFPVPVSEINAALDSYVKGQSEPLPGGYWLFRGAREELNSLLNVALGLDPNSMVEDPQAYFDAVQQRIADGDAPVFQVTVKRTASGNYENVDVSFSLAVE